MPKYAPEFGFQIAALICRHKNWSCSEGPLLADRRTLRAVTDDDGNILTIVPAPTQKATMLATLIVRQTPKAELDSLCIEPAELEIWTVQRLFTSTVRLSRIAIFYREDTHDYDSQREGKPEFWTVDHGVAGHPRAVRTTPRSGAGAP